MGMIEQPTGARGAPDSLKPNAGDPGSVSDRFDRYLLPRGENTNVLLVTGPLGSGKTTFINSLLEQHSPALGSFIVVVNDVGDLNIDGIKLQVGEDQKEKLSAGCVCCDDGESVRRVVLENAGKLDSLVIEPTGIADANQLHELLDLPKVDLRTICLVDVKHFEAHRTLGTLRNQIPAADVILLTWTDHHHFNGDRKDKIGTALEYIGELNPHAPILQMNGQGHIDPDFVPRLYGLDRPLVNRRLDVTKPSTHHHQHNGHSCCGDHDHHQHTHHHGVFSKSFRFNPDATVDDFIEGVQPLLAEGVLLRAKGSIGDQWVEVVGGDITITRATDNSDNGLNIITTRPITLGLFGGKAEYVSGEQRSLKDILLDKDGRASPEESVALAKDLLARYPKPGQHHRSDGGVIVSNEFDVIAKVAAREGVPVELLTEGLAKMIDWRVGIAEALERGNYKDPNNHLPYWKYDVYGSIAAYAYKNAAVLPPELMNKVALHRPATTCLEGLSELNEIPVILQYDGLGEPGSSFSQFLKLMHDWAVERENMPPSRTNAALDNLARVDQGGHWARWRVENIKRLIGLDRSAA